MDTDETEEQQLQRALEESVKVTDAISQVMYEDEMNKKRNEELMRQDLKLGSVSNFSQFRPVCEQRLLPDNKLWTQYHLRSIVKHLGMNYSSGHYITHVLDRNNENGEHKWMKHDDVYVSQISNEKATNDQAQMSAYIFFYVHESATEYKGKLGENKIVRKEQEANLNENVEIKKEEKINIDSKNEQNDNDSTK